MELTSQQTIVRALIGILLAAIVVRLGMGEAGYQENVVFDALLILIYVVMVVLLVLGTRYVWQNRGAVRHD